MDVDETIDAFSILLNQNNGIFRLWHSGGENIQKVKVFNLSGQLLYEHDAMNKSVVEIDLRQVTTGNLLLFKVTDDKGRTTVKKAVKK